VKDEKWNVKHRLPSNRRCGGQPPVHADDALDALAVGIVAEPGHVASDGVGHRAQPVLRFPRLGIGDNYTAGDAEWLYSPPAERLPPAVIHPTHR